MAANGSDKPLVVVTDKQQQEDVRDYEVETRAHVAHLKLSDADRQTLQEPIPVGDLDILPSGEVYASQIQYRRRLNKVFGPGGWKLEERSDPRVQENSIIQKWELICLGIPIAVCWGEQDRVGRQSWATAIESAKSNALTRTCKDLGIASECWDRNFTENFKKEHCVEVRLSGAPGRAWRRKDRDKFWNETGLMRAPVEESGAGQTARGSSTAPPRRGSKPQPAPPTPTEGDEPLTEESINPDLAAELRQTLPKIGMNEQAMCKQFHVERLEDLTEEKYAAVMRIVNAKRGGGDLKLE